MQLRYKIKPAMLRIGINPTFVRLQDQDQAVEKKLLLPLALSEALELHPKRVKLT
jgi:hypothetical protein